MGPHTQCQARSRCPGDLGSSRGGGEATLPILNAECETSTAAQLWSGSPWRLSWGCGRGRLRFKRLQRVLTVLWGGVGEGGTNATFPLLRGTKRYQSCYPITRQLLLYLFLNLQYGFISFHSTPASPALTSFSCRVSFP